MIKGEEGNTSDATWSTSGKVTEKTLKQNGWSDCVLGKINP